jgi:hypothetical protein
MKPINTRIDQSNTRSIYSTVTDFKKSIGYWFFKRFIGI